MDITKTLYVSERETWREWLAAHHATASDIWLIYPKKGSGRPSLPYNDAVEEALCFAWIDSTRKSYTEEATVQRFSPRRKGSSYSQINIERLRRMREQGKLLPDVEIEVEEFLAAEFDFPEDIMATLRDNPRAWSNFQRFSAPYQRIRVAYIDHARSRPEEFEKRLANFLQKTEQNKQFGFGIESYY